MQNKKLNLNLYQLSILFIIISAILISFLSGIIYLYSDDVFYASFLKNGFDNFINMNIEHYNTINGRMLVHIIDETVLFLGKYLFIFINPLFLIGFSYICAKIQNNSAYKEKTLYISAVILFFIMCLPKEVINESVYWITGSMNYTLPAVLVVLMYYILKINIDTGKYNLSLVLICIAAGATTEQGGFLAVMLTLLFVLTQNPSNWRLFHIAPLLCLLGLLSIILAPGTLLRISYTKAVGFSFYSIFNTMPNNLSPLSTYLTGKGGIHAILAILVLSISFIIFKQKKISPLLFLGIVIGGILVYQKSFNQFDTYLCIITSVSSLAFISIWSFIALFKNQYKDTAIFILGAVSLLCFMLISPVLGTRVLLISSLFLSASIGGLCIDLIKNRVIVNVFVCVLALILMPIYIGITIVLISLALNIKKSLLKLQPVLVFCIFLLFFMPIASGYYSNFKILKSNEKNIRTAQVSGRLYWNIDLEEPYRHRLFYENSDFLPYFLAAKNLSKTTEVYLVSKNHKPLYFGNKRLKSPSIKDTVMYYPLRDMFEAVGASVTWDNKTYSIIVEFKNTTYILKDDWHVTRQQGDETDIILLKDKKQTMLCRTYIPESFIENIFNIKKQEDKILYELKK